MPSPYKMRLRLLNVSASSFRACKGLRDLIDISLRTDVIDAGTFGIPFNISIWFIVIVFRIIRLRASICSSDIEIGEFMPPPE